MIDIQENAKIIDDAARTATAVEQLSKFIQFDEPQAYEIQKASIDRRLERGEKIVGVKMGFTSRAKMRQMNVHEMIWGRLTDAMRIEDGGEINIENYVHPRAEPEIAFLLKKPLSGPTSPLEALAAVEAIAPAIEIIDSRYENFKFSLTDVIADNSSSSGFVVGNWKRPDLQIENLGITLEVNGQIEEIGSTAAILGHPARALAAASRLAGVSMGTLEAGWIIMAGSATPAVHLHAGDNITAKAQNMGRVSFNVR